MSQKVDDHFNIQNENITLYSVYIEFVHLHFWFNKETIDDHWMEQNMPPSNSKDQILVGRYHTIDEARVAIKDFVPSPFRWEDYRIRWVLFGQIAYIEKAIYEIKDGDDEDPEFLRCDGIYNLIYDISNVLDSNVEV